MVFQSVSTDPNGRRPDDEEFDLPDFSIQATGLFVRPGLADDFSALRSVEVTVSVAGSEFTVFAEIPVSPAGVDAGTVADALQAAFDASVVEVTVQATDFRNVAVPGPGSRTDKEAALGDPCDHVSLYGAEGFRIESVDLDFSTRPGDLSGYTAVSDLSFGGRRTTGTGRDRDTMEGSNGDDTISGGSIADTISGFGGDDLLDGQAGDDRILGGDGNDTVTGGADDDTLLGGSGNDALEGGDGEDLLTGEAGADTLDGGNEDDTVGGGDGPDLVRGGFNDDFLLGGSGDDRIAGEVGNDTVDGGGGNDSITGDLGNDDLRGGAGRDSLDGGPGRDRIDGGAGTDTAVFGVARADVLISEGSMLTVAGPDGTDTLFGIEAIEFADSVVFLDGRRIAPEEARQVAYLYEAGLDRDGTIDTPGLNFWIDRREGGLSPQALARAFLESDEFAAAFGAPETLDNRALVETLYRNVLNREGEAGGIGFWSGELDAGASRPAVLLAFAESPENIAGSPAVATLGEVEAGIWDFG